MSSLNVRSGLVALLAVFITSPAWANVVIGTWEQSTDGWIDWGSAQTAISPTPGGKFSYSTTGATHGSSSLQLTQAGWNQNLAIKLQEQGHIPAFMANTRFEIDVTVPPISDGWMEIFEVVLNSPAGYQPQPINPGAANPNVFGFAHSPNPQTVTLGFDYGHLIASGAIPPNPGWVEIIFATNNGGGAPTTFYFDNARLVPEPGALALLAIAATGFLRRRRA
jgi:hypothetical protein